ncbi:hypothetical protein C3L33_22874, partial [Rhododendron williamsianum]
MYFAGEGDSRSVLDAFFFGKAQAEAVNDRVESAVGEFFSTLCRLQAEQQKQVQDFQSQEKSSQPGKSKNVKYVSFMLDEGHEHKK